MDFLLKGGSSKIGMYVFYELLNRDKKHTRKIFDLTPFKYSSLLCRKALGVDFVLRGGSSKIGKCVFYEHLNRDKKRTREILDLTRFKYSSLLCGKG